MAVFRYLTRNVLITTKQEFTRTVPKRFTSYEYGGDKSPAPVFFKTEVQNLLKSLTRVDLDKIYQPKKMGAKKLEPPVYKFMTNEQLEDARRAAVEEADALIQMPPAVKVRAPINKILNKDPALQGLETARIVFTDISFGVDNNERIIVVREPDGTLQNAEWTLRDRMNQVYFPVKHKELHIPKMFAEDNLKSLLDRKEYVFVLDRACLQFEPSDRIYQQITTSTYLHVNENSTFDILRSTRHFGSLTFFLVWFKMVDNLLLELIETTYMEDAKDLIKLYGIVHGVQLDLNSTDLVEEFIKKYTDKKGPLELALQACKDLEKERQQLQTGIKKAHGHL